MTEVVSSSYQISLSSLFDRVEALFKQAEIALSKEQFDLADYFFQAAHNKDPENLALVLNEAQIWHRHGKLLGLSRYFHKGYRVYKTCFNDQQLQKKAYLGALDLKLDEFESTGIIGAIDDLEKLISVIEKKQLSDLIDELEPYKARVYFHKGCHFKDVKLLMNAYEAFKLVFKTRQNSDNAQLLSEASSQLFELVQDPSYMIQALMHTKDALDLDGQKITNFEALAESYKKLFHFSLDESHIQNFHETCELASLIFPDNTSLYILWSEGLIDMGIAGDKIDWVKLGMEKSYQALSRTGSTQICDFLIARAFSYLGKKLDRLSHIQDAFEKIKNYDEDPLNERLVSTLCEILVSFGQYFQDVDYMYQAIEKLQESLSYDSSKRHFWINMASIYYDISALDQNYLAAETALKMIDKALSFYRCPKSLLLKASIHLKLGELKQTLDHYELSAGYFDYALNLHPHIFQPTPYHLFEHARALDFVGNYQENEELYMRSLDLLAQIMLLEPKFKDLHHQIALVQFHLGELTMNPELMKKCLSHFKLALQNSDNDAIYVDWAIACLALSEMVSNQHEILYLQHEASIKLQKALKGGQVQAYYFMACLCCVCKECDKALELLKIAERHEALPSADDLMADEWLESLRHEHEFIKLVERQEMKKSY